MPKLVKLRPDHSPRSLSDRQREVVSLVARGLSNAEIAVKLGISLPTVRTHLHTVFLRLGARNRVEAAMKFMKG